MPTPVIAIFDIGKTNKKIILFDDTYKILQEQTKVFPEIADENGDPCEDIQSITLWIKDTVAFLQLLEHIEIKAINVSAYGASFVHLNANFEIATPFYNYLKFYPRSLQEKFYETYGGQAELTRETASPALGSLNSGLQLYRLKYESPNLFRTIFCSLHLPQYFSYLITSKTYSEITSIGCHTHLWDFKKNRYHDWVIKEGLDEKLPVLIKSDEVQSFQSIKLNRPMIVGCGLHDSSSALIPYLTSFIEPFVLISTGTWCISMNPFNHSPLTDEELKRDCLCYLSYRGKPVKSARLFAGHDHEIQVERLCLHFNKGKDYYKTVKYDSTLRSTLLEGDKDKNKKIFNTGIENSTFETRELSSFTDFEKAYHQLMLDIMDMQFASTTLVLKNTTVSRIFVDGGFSKNPVYMSLLATAFPNIEVFGATIAQASSLGAALAIHHQWNRLPMPENIIELKHYAGVVTN